MTAVEVIKAFQSYYGKYNPVVARMVLEYLDGINEDKLELLFRVVLMDYSGQYHYPPDVSVIDSAREGYNKNNEYRQIYSSWLSDARKKIETDKEAKKAELRASNDAIEQRPVVISPASIGYFERIRNKLKEGA